MSYIEKLRAVQEENDSWLCVGLDPDPDKLRVSIGSNGTNRFCRSIKVLLMRRPI